MPEISDSVTQRAQDIPKSYHIGCLITTLLLLANLAVDYIAFFSKYKDDKFWNEDGAKFYLILGLAFFVLLYFGECYGSASHEYLKTDLEIYEYESHIRELKAAPPRIGTRIKCYHYRDHMFEKETYYDAQGKKKERSAKSDWEKVTYEGSSYFNYNHWEDTSGHIMGVFNGGELIKLEVDPEYKFGDLEVEQRYNAHREEYIEKNKCRDDHLEHFPIFEIPGHKKYVLVKNKGTTKPCCLHVCWYWFWSLLLLSWPYRLWFEFLAEGKRIKIHKVVYDQPHAKHIL